MAKKSIELCDECGVDAASAIIDKIYDPDNVELTVRRQLIARIARIEHVGDDGLPVIHCEMASGEPFDFQFKPDSQPMRDTAVDADGKPICA